MPPFPGFPEAGRSRRETHFAHIARTIVYQQLAGSAARAIHGRVAALTPDPRFPRPEVLLALPPQRLLDAGLSRAKCAALLDLAQRVVAGDLRLAGIARHDDDEIIERLTAVRGIGVWSAQMFLMFRLGRLDVMPSSDLGVREGLRRLDGADARPTPKALDARAADWAPLRSVAAWVLWRLTED